MKKFVALMSVWLLVIPAYGVPDIYGRMVFFANYSSTSSVPSPSETPARIIVSGRTATAVDIKIVNVGQNIPLTYAGSRINNTPGFEFYVSEHYALKSSMGEEFSKEKLMLAELAYHQTAAMLGAEPPDPAVRMYVIYAQNGEQLREAMISDVGSAPGGFLGGFTLWGNMSSYNLWSRGQPLRIKNVIAITGTM